MSTPNLVKIDYTAASELLGDGKMIRSRIRKNRITEVLIFIISFLVVVPLVFILGYLVVHGISSIDLNFLTKMPRPVGETGGGILNALAGSAIIVVISIAISVPLSVLAGVYVAESAHSKLTYFIQLSTDVLQGTPSIVIGIFAWIIAVVPFGHFSALSGSIALGIMILPVVIKSTEETVKRIPVDIREASAALGVPYHRFVLKVLIPTGKKGILNGILLGSTRISGETAPLLFTAFGSPFFVMNPGKPMSSLPLVIYTYATSPYDEWHRLAWGASLVLILAVFGFNLAARFLTSEKGGR